MRCCYLIGNPVGHSMSAVMHNAAFRELGLNFRYDLMSVSPEELNKFINWELRKLNVIGANVTIPYKVSVVNLVDEVDVTTRRIGAINTIVNEKGWLKGYNTDGIGAIRALEESYGSLHGVKAVIIGAGGAARAIACHLSSIADDIKILNRTLSKARKLADSISELSGCTAHISAMPFHRDCLVRALEGADILINATSIGMRPNIDMSPVEGNLLRPDLFVFDIVCNPLRTRLLKEAKRAGARTLSGVSMLVYQGALSFKLWTGVDAPEDLMARVVVEALGE